MTDLIESTLHRLHGQLSGRLSRSGERRYSAATAIWAKPVGPMPRAVAHCRTAQDVQSAIRAARDCDLPLSVRGGGHDWAGRALCDGIVIDLTAMNDVTLSPDYRAARISGGARASDVFAATDPRGLAVVTGSCSSVGMTGLTLGGGYGSLIARFGLALDNLLAADVVLADGRVVTASRNNEEELFWALRGGGSNFGVVTAMQHRTHYLPRVHSGMLLFPFAEARAVLEGCVDIMAAAPEELTVQLGLTGGPDGSPLVMVLPTWCGLPEQGEVRLAPFLELGTLVNNTLTATAYGASLAIFDPFLVTGQRVSWRRAGFRCSTARVSTLSFARWRLHLHRAAPSSPTSSGVPPHACRRRRPPSASAAIMSSSRSSHPSPIGRSRVMSAGIGSGCKPRVGPLTASRCRAGIQISSPALRWNARQ
jgi:FAD binding domain